MSAAWVPKAGECLLIDSGPAGKHLFIILCSCKTDRGEEFILVPICSVADHAKADPTCVIQAGAHPFVVHESFIEYRNARLDPADILIARVKDFTFIPNAPAPADLLANALNGLRTSKFVKKYLKTLIG